MPTIPSVNSQRNITASTAEPLRNGEAAVPYQNIQKAVGAVEEVTQAWSNAHDVMQTTNAKGLFKVAQVDLFNRVDSEVDFSKETREKYAKELDKIKANSLESVDNMAIRNNLANEMDNDNQLLSMRLESLFANKEIEHTRAVSMPNLIQGYQSAMINSASESEYITNKHALLDEIDKNVHSGVYNYLEGEKLKKASLYGTAESAIYQNPEAGMKQIDSGRYDLTAEEKSKLTDTARSLIKHRDEINEWKAKQSNIQGSFQLSQALHDKTLTHEMVKGMQQSGIIDSETAAIFDSIALKKGYEIPSSTSLAEPDYFVRLIEDSNGDKVKVDKILKDSAKAYGESKIGSNQYLYLIQQASEAFDRQSKGLSGMSRSQSMMKYATDGLKAYANVMSNTPPALLYKLLTKFTDRFKQGDDPEKIKQEIIEEHIGEEINKAKSDLNPDGTMMISPDGRRGFIPKANIEKALKRGYKYAK